MGDMWDETRWQTLLRSSFRMAWEFQAAWGVLQGEAENCCRYLGWELDEPLASTIHDVGQGCVDGSTRFKVTEQREKLREAVLQGPCSSTQTRLPS